MSKLDSILEELERSTPSARKGLLRQLFHKEDLTNVTEGIQLVHLLMFAVEGSGLHVKLNMPGEAFLDEPCTVQFPPSVKSSLRDIQKVELRLSVATQLAYASLCEAVRVRYKHIKGRFSVVATWFRSRGQSPKPPQWMLNRLRQLVTTVGRVIGRLLAESDPINRENFFKRRDDSRLASFIQHLVALLSWSGEFAGFLDLSDKPEASEMGTRMLRLLLQYHAAHLAYAIEQERLDPGALMASSMRLLFAPTLEEKDDIAAYRATAVLWVAWLLESQPKAPSTELGPFLAIQLLKLKSEKLVTDLSKKLSQNSAEHRPAIVELLSKPLKLSGIVSNSLHITLIYPAFQLFLATPASVTQVVHRSSPWLCESLTDMLTTPSLLHASSSLSDELQATIAVYVTTKELIAQFMSHGKSPTRYTVVDCRSTTSFNILRVAGSRHIGVDVDYSINGMQILIQNLVKDQHESSTMTHNSRASPSHHHWLLMGTGRRQQTKEAGFLSFLLLQFLALGVDHVAILQDGFAGLIPSIRAGQVRVEGTRSIPTSGPKPPQQQQPDVSSTITTAGGATVQVSDDLLPSVSELRDAVHTVKTQAINMIPVDKETDIRDTFESQPSMNSSGEGKEKATHSNMKDHFALIVESDEDDAVELV